MNRVEFIDELGKLINRYSIENGSDTPDWILRDYMHGCLVAYENATIQREFFYGREVRGAKPEAPGDIPYPSSIPPVLDYGPRDEFVEALRQAKVLELLEIRNQAKQLNDEYTLKACDDELRRREQNIGKT